MLSLWVLALLGLQSQGCRLMNPPMWVSSCISVALCPSLLAWGEGGKESCLVLHHSEVILGLQRPHKSASQMGVSIKGSSLFASLKFPFYLN